MITSLDALKAHLNVTLNDDDALLTAKLKAAQTAVENYTGLDFADEYAAFVPAIVDGSGVVTTPAIESDAPAPLMEAVLKYAAHLYDYRMPASPDDKTPTAPLTVFDLVGPYKKWSF